MAVDGAARRSRLDLFEQTTLVVIFCWFVFRMVTNLSLLTYIYLVDQLIVLAFVLGRRRTNEISIRRGDWFAGFAGTFLPLLVEPVTDQALLPLTAFFAIMVVGVAIHLSAKITLRRSMGIVAANRGVKMGGPYRLVRHPMYLGYAFVYTSLLIIWPTPRNIVIIAACCALALWRINAEERVLSEDASYRDLVERTPFKLLPGVY